MPTFFVEEHAITRYRQRVRNCSFAEAHAYIQESAPQGAWMKGKARGRNGGSQIRLSDCVLVVKDYSHSRKYDYAVITVLGPNETDDREVDMDDMDDEMSRLNAMADISRSLSPSESVTLKLDEGRPSLPWIGPMSLLEGKKQKKDLLRSLEQLRRNRYSTSKLERIEFKESLRKIETELMLLNQWLKTENKRMATEDKARADAGKRKS